MLAGFAMMLMVASVVVKNRREEQMAQSYRAALAKSNVLAEDPLAAKDARRAADDLIRKYAPFVGPVALGEVLAVTGDFGFTARLRVVPGNDAASYTVRIQNGGTKPFDGSFSKGGAWLDTDHGRFYPPTVRILPTGTAAPSAIGPNTEANLALTFKIPAQARPTGLVLSLRLGKYYPNAQWTLTP
ncbi:hypothetical protein [Krasilnikovia sp. M28-CT-15]|uniref:hypothetical protein n=1 Tax=Krasilnikovia sp. M28-CT-15 TaxID=3373540 RepID=UPI00399D559D